MNTWIEIEAQKERQKDWLRAVERQRVADAVSVPEKHARGRYGWAVGRVGRWLAARRTGLPAQSTAEGEGTLPVVARPNVSRS